MDEIISGLIEDLTQYARINLGLGIEDAVFARNQLLELFMVEPSERKAQTAPVQEILNLLVEYAIDRGIAEEGSEVRFETKIMGIVTPSAGLVVKTFCDLYEKSGSQSATDYLYRISVNSNYIRMSDIRKNIRWYADGAKGKIGITINLSKPEKDAKQVLAEKNFVGKKYPKCMLCIENLGFCGTLTHPARQTLRIAPITLNNEPWHLQYSPYVYYDEHCIAFSDEHKPMSISPLTFTRLLDFVQIFPDYFLGSNADLPIVGGSILSHEHYQGGKKVLPMFSRPFRKKFIAQPNFTVGIRDWYNSVVTVKGTDKNAVARFAELVLNKWIEYSDERVNIRAYTDKERHNTITPIASKNGNEYCLDLILRNNRTDSSHPFGIFHPTEDMHNIKKEGIGLIEAMGLFILPGRLRGEIMAMIEVLGGSSVDFAKVNEDSALSKHLGLIAQLSAEGNLNLAPKEAQDKIIDKVNAVCLAILECTAVFKNNDKGQDAFAKFLNTVVNS